MIKFGTGGFRAIIGDDFTRENVNLLTQGLANRIIKEKNDKYPVTIGYDRRFLSDTAAKWASEVLAGNNIPVKFVYEAVPTPVVMFDVKQNKTKYGMAITASHNPYSYNGVKVFTEGGRDATEIVTNDIEAEIEKITTKDVKLVDFDEAVKSGKVEIVNPLNEYIDSILSFMDLDKIKNSGLKVLVDPMYGVATRSILTILNTARVSVDVMHDNHDAFFGHKNPAPAIETLTELRRRVAEEGYDLGLAQDGDADRIGLIDAYGNYIHANDILVLLYYYLVKYKGWTGDCVRNLATTHLLDKVAESFGKKCYEVPVGFKHISAKMQETDALIGGESSGGLTVRGHIFGKDGVYGAALLVEMVAVIGKPLHEIIQDIKNEYGEFFMGEYNVGFKMETKQRLMDLLFVQKELPKFDIEIEKVSYLDGCKVYFKNGGWIICRFSGTEPIIRIFCEQKTEEEANKITNTMIKFLGL